MKSLKRKIENLKDNKHNKIITYDINNNILPYEVSKQLAEICGKKFTRDCDDEIFIERLHDGDKLTVVLKNGKPVAYLRWFIYSGLINKKKREKMSKYLDLLKKDDFIFLAELASDEKGMGKFIMEYFLMYIKGLGLPIVTVPKTDDLISYYEQFGFTVVRPNNEKFPNVIMVKYW